ncbi:hypothetical protein [Paenibacillus sp. JCM 10914]|uniref:hypothetical protein n=1 Tax=Paenibacillus sp. JCM 10914 TaxID=1236974 RepID=UPI0003CC7224|nr:hypothetical protein [Paenibacillus sp. JCM 10914]GAE04448.1 hypothetical protein JCM10914_494 [Paenibacillus sp. JCM 10914]
MERFDSDPKLYRSLDDAAGHILSMISQIIHVNTLFVASNDKVTNTIFKVFNRQEQLIQEGVACHMNRRTAVWLLRKALSLSLLKIQRNTL